MLVNDRACTIGLPTLFCPQNSSAFLNRPGKLRLLVRVSQIAHTQEVSDAAMKQQTAQTASKLFQNWMRKGW